MSRTRYRYDRDLDKVVEIFDHNQPRPPSGAFFMPDLDRAYGGGFVSPIDGQHITSRSQLRAHNAKHGVAQSGDFRPRELVNRENRRVEDNRRVAKGESFKWN